MTIYRKKVSGRFRTGLRWFIAIVVFVITMTITWSDVYGAGF